jgi:hypothetical protein
MYLFPPSFRPVRRKTLVSTTHAVVYVCIFYINIYLYIYLYMHFIFCLFNDAHSSSEYIAWARSHDNFSRDKAYEFFCHLAELVSSR